MQLVEKPTNVAGKPGKVKVIIAMHTVIFSAQAVCMEVRLSISPRISDTHHKQI